MAGEFEQIGERVAEHRAAAVADMHRPGRIGRNIFDIDLFRRATLPAAPRPKSAATAQDGAQDLGEDRGFRRMLRKPGPATSA